MTETALGATAPTEEKAPEFVTLSIVHAASHSHVKCLPLRVRLFPKKKCHRRPE